MTQCLCAQLVSCPFLLTYSSWARAITSDSRAQDMHGWAILRCAFLKIRAYANITCA